MHIYTQEEIDDMPDFLTAILERYLFCGNKRRPKQKLIKLGCSSMKPRKNILLIESCSKKLSC